jgi:hypothetical protein
MIQSSPQLRSPCQNHWHSTCPLKRVWQYSSVCPTLGGSACQARFTSEAGKSIGVVTNATMRRCGLRKIARDGANTSHMGQRDQDSFAEIVQCRFFRTIKKIQNTAANPEFSNSHACERCPNPERAKPSAKIAFETLANPWLGTGVCSTLYADRT